MSQKEKTPDDNRESSEEASTDLPFVAEGLERPHTSKPTSNHNVFQHSSQSPDCEDCKLEKTI